MLMATVEDGTNMNANVQPEIQTNIVNTHRGWRFWVILGSLYVASLLSAIEATGEYPLQTPSSPIIFSTY